MHVGWIGLGSMGKPMALSVLKGGHAVAGFARRPQEHEAIREAGGIVGDALIETVSTADIVCVNLFSEAQIREVVVDGGVLAMMPAGSILAIHSTVSPGFVRELARRRTDIDVLDAGFSGGPDEAAAGKLTLMVGGDAAVLERARPVFTCYSDQIAHAGALGSGMTLKVINNLMFAANVAVARDALRLVRAGGLDLRIAIETLARGSAGSTALGILGRGGDPEAMVAGIGRYLEKDVTIARLNARGLDLGTLDAATAEFDRT